MRCLTFINFVSSTCTFMLLLRNNYWTFNTFVVLLSTSCRQVVLLCCCCVIIIGHLSPLSSSYCQRCNCRQIDIYFSNTKKLNRSSGCPITSHGLKLLTVSLALVKKMFLFEGDVARKVTFVLPILEQKDTDLYFLAFNSCKFLTVAATEHF